jgi:hypothetical protein
MSHGLKSLGIDHAFDIETGFEAAALFSINRLQIEKIIGNTYHIYAEDSNRKKFNGEKGIGIYLLEYGREEDGLFLKIKKEETTRTFGGLKLYLPILLMKVIPPQISDIGAVVNASVQITYNPDDSVALYLGESLFPKENLKERTLLQKGYERIKTFIG